MITSTTVAIVDSAPQNGSLFSIEVCQCHQPLGMRRKATSGELQRCLAFQQAAARVALDLTQTITGGSQCSTHDLMPQVH